MRKFHVRKLLLLPGAGFLLAGLWALPARAKPAGNLETYFYLHAADEVKGTVVDAFGKPLPLVEIRVKSSSATAVTNTDGEFSIKAQKGDVLILSLKDFNSTEFTVRDADNFTVRLSHKFRPNDSTYQILYGTQKRSTNIQSISEVYTQELNKTYSTNLYGMLTGRMAGLAISQQGGLPGFIDENTASLRDRAPMVMIDGSPGRNVLSINPEQIESVTLLKDALSTAMYGMRAANGILMITTRKGDAGPQRIDFTATAGVTQPTKSYTPTSAYDFARLYNEALANENKPAAYSDADLEAYRTHSDPYGHPDVDWRDEVLRKNALFQRYNLNVSGGRENARYFVSLDYTNQNGLYKTESFNKYNTNADVKRYQVRSNIDVKVNRSISASLNIMGRIQTNNEPGALGLGIMRSILTTPRNAYPVKNPDGSLGGNGSYSQNIYGETVMSGYTNLYTRDLNADLNLRGDLSDLVKGLWAKGTASFYTNFTELIVRSKDNAVYSMRVEPGGDTTYQKFGESTDMSNSTGSNTTERFLFTEAQLGYTRQFGKHGVNAILTGNNDTRTLGSQLPQTFIGVGGRFQYNFDERYMAEVAVGYNGTNRYHPDRRYDWFPAFGLGWNIAKEDFMQSASWLSALKLRASYGKVGNSFNSNRTFGTGESYFIYNQYYVTGTSYSFGTTHTSLTGVREGALNNEFVTWEKAKKANIGLDIAILKNKLSFTADYYNNKFYDVLMTRGSNTALLGVAYPQENIGVTRYTGVEFTANYQNTINNKLNYWVNANLSFNKGVSEFIDEPNKPYSWLIRTGRYTGMSYGYLSDGLFKTDEEAQKAAQLPGAVPRAGDIKYKDLNDDGVINAFDETLITPEKPDIYYGLNMGLSCHGIDLAVLFQGVANRYSNVRMVEFGEEGKNTIYAHHLNRWTPQTAETATYPRLTIGGSFNNTQNSDYWIQNTSYLRLKNIELGYTLPYALTHRIRIASTRIFVNGTNLLTFTKVKDTDPENLAGNYPILKVLYAGINIKF
ncbi:SusC/RagA family TonB-linked outer membrane protein [Chitinophaga barathri]|uniref:TonB-dependent receptor n=1 Tax=Chitinophaga barathri TaxID=1647451 RepID=A0A3N4MED9_9BACT|nr:TonB-dependent receptor [Chitinophaga barathri]RPD41948.1 TonB-dependent receptor [Chitinophaga barathri]